MAFYTFDPAWQEEDVVHVLATFLRDDSYVLSARPSQARIFFSMQGGYRKAPDIVAYQTGFLLVLECKVSASALFRPEALSGLSDAECMLFLQGSSVAQEELLQTASGILAARGVSVRQDSMVVPGLVAGSAFGSDHLAQAEGLLCLEVLPPGIGIRVARPLVDLPWEFA